MGIALLTAVGALVAAPLAVAEEAEFVVPPDNSAVNQYTETYPTAGGDRDAHKGSKGQTSPNKVLGSRNARRLEQQGAEGRAAAEVAAETAPSVEEEPAPVDDERSEAAPPAAGGGDGKGGTGGGEAKPDAKPGGSADTANHPAASPSTDVEVPSGSSGISEVFAQATGSSSSGELGLLLPFVILAALGWAIVVLLRRRPRRTAR